LFDVLQISDETHRGSQRLQCFRLLQFIQHHHLERFLLEEDELIMTSTLLLSELSELVSFGSHDLPLLIGSREDALGDTPLMVGSIIEMLRSILVMGDH
jgi:hypothetical protein